MTVRQLEHDLQVGQAGVEVSFFTRCGKRFCQAWHFFEEWQNGRILAVAAVIAVDVPLGPQKFGDSSKKYFRRRFFNVQILLERPVAGADFFSGFDRPQGEHDDVVDAADRPLPDVWIAGVVDPGGSKTDDLLFAEVVWRVQKKLLNWGAEFRAEIYKIKIKQNYIFNN